MDIINSIEDEQLKATIPDIKVGDTVRGHQRVKERNRERIQVFEGIVIKKQNGGLNETFTVRRISYGVGVEKTFLVHSPLVEKVELVRVGKVRRAKLYYLRDRVGKAAKTKENIGANLKREEIVVKEETAVAKAEEEVKAETTEAPITEAVKTEEAPKATEEAKAEAPKATEEVKAEAPKTEETAKPAEDKKAE